MPPLFLQAEGRQRNAPADRRLADSCYALAVELDEAAANYPGGLFSKELDELCDLRIDAQAYGDLLESDDPTRFLADWIRFARSCMKSIVANQ